MWTSRDQFSYVALGKLLNHPVNSFMENYTNRIMLALCSSLSICNLKFQSHDVFLQWYISLRCSREIFFFNCHSCVQQIDDIQHTGSFGSGKGLKKYSCHNYKEQPWSSSATNWSPVIYQFVSPACQGFHINLRCLWHFPETDITFF